MTSDEAERIATSAKQALGIDLDVSRFEHVVDASGVRHVFKKHGDARTEVPRALAPVTDEDFARIPDLIENADQIDVSPKLTTRSKLPAVVYQKTLNDVQYKLVYMVEARPGKRVLALKTMLKIPVQNGAPAKKLGILDLLKE